MWAMWASWPTVLTVLAVGLLLWLGRDAVLVAAWAMGSLFSQM